MKILSVAFGAISVMGLAACATTENPIAQAGAATSVAGGAPKSFELGSRIPRTTTDRVVKKTERDLADEPVRSIGNTVGIKGQ